jgi:phosphoglycolate phosphatase-like HAD superfamily hydrolase
MPDRILARVIGVPVKKLLEEYKIVFWDFDGVIKDSVNVKSLGYENLFSSFGKKVVARVNQHHKVHGGISRFEKIPLYLSWAGQPSNPVRVQEYCERFSKLVLQAVIDSPWVLGVQEYLKFNNSRQCFILITGTPQEEIEQILKALELTSCFREVHGAPKKKAVVIKDVLKRLNYLSDQAMVVGDSGTDLQAARENKVSFLLRKTPFNQDLQKQFQGPSFTKLNF